MTTARSESWLPAGPLPEPGKVYRLGPGIELDDESPDGSRWAVGRRAIVEHDRVWMDRAGTRPGYHAEILLVKVLVRGHKVREFRCIAWDGEEVSP